MTFHEVRIAFTVEPFDQAVQFYRDRLGLAIVNAWQSEQGRGVVLVLGHKATLKLLDPIQATVVDQMEVGQRVSGPVRLARAVEDVATTAHTMRAAGARMTSGPTLTPWGDYNARLVAPNGMHLTLFQSFQPSTQERGRRRIVTQSRKERNRLIIQEFRAHGGSVVESVGTPLLLLTTTGAKSGQ